MDRPLGLGGVRSEGVGVFGILLLDVGEVDSGMLERISQAAVVEQEQIRVPTFKCTGGKPLNGPLIGDNVGSSNGVPLAYSLNPHQNVASVEVGSALIAAAVGGWANSISTAAGEYSLPAHEVLMKSPDDIRAVGTQRVWCLIHEGRARARLVAA